MRDLVKVSDHLRLLARDSDSRAVMAEVLSELEEEKIQRDGYFSAVCRERGKLVPGTRRFGHNVWTLSGREHLAQLQSYSSYSPLTGARTDRIRYVGFGTGSQPETSGVTKLVTPIEYVVGIFLAGVSLPTYPLSPSRTAVRYSRTFTETELSVVGTVILTEAGLYTDGDPASSWEPGTRDVDLSKALLQAPNSYKVFEPLTKTQNFVLEVSWEVRF